MAHRSSPLSRSLSLAALLVVACSLVAQRTSAVDADQAIDPSLQGRPLTPAGSLVPDLTTRQPAVGALPVRFLRSPDRTGPNGRGRYLVVVNSGFGVEFNASTKAPMQSLAVIDLTVRPAPAVVQNVYFPSPQSAHVGAVFAHRPSPDGSFRLFVSGGVENKIWLFTFKAGDTLPISPASNGPDTKITAPFVDVSGLTSAAPSDEYNSGQAPVYPIGLGLSGDDDTLVVANNLGDSVGVVRGVSRGRALARVDLRRSGSDAFVYPYDVAILDSGASSKAYVSLWNDSSVAVVEPAHPERPARFVAVGRHPTALLLDSERQRVFVVNSDDDTVSVIDTRTDAESERIAIRLNEDGLLGNSPEGLALSDDGATLYVANAHSNSVAVVELGRAGERSTVRGFIPAGRYPSAVAVAEGTVYIGNGKGTGFESSSLVVNNSGMSPNVANDRYPAVDGRGGQYILSLLSGNISALMEPSGPELAAYTQQVMRNNGLVGEAPRSASALPPIKHVIYVIKENRTYDQVFGDMAASGDGHPADGDATLAIFGGGDAARRAGGPPQDVTPNQHALAARFGLFDRFFVNSEASPDGHNWSTAAFSSDYVDKAYRWDYSGRGRTYDYEGFNRMPEYEPVSSSPGLYPSPATSADVAAVMRRYIPYLHGSRDVAEPQSLYLWDAAARAGLSYRSYGEFIATVSQSDVTAINARRTKTYPDLSPTIEAIPTKKTLEGHHSSAFRAFDMYSPDAMTADSYRAARATDGRVDAVVSQRQTDDRFRGTSRFGAWLEEFQGYADDRQAGRPDRMPSLSLLRFVCNHTAGVSPGMATPQFMVADNDYAVGRLVQAVSESPYWRDTAIFILEDDAQDGADHVDAHRSPVLVISAYNRPGALVHQFHTTVSLIRTIEMLLGLPPMNQLDAAAVPMDVFGSQPDLRPFVATLPSISLDNLVTPSPSDSVARYWADRTAEQDFSHADVADPHVLNQAIWFSVRGSGAEMPAVAHLPAFDALRAGIRAEAEDEDDGVGDGDGAVEGETARRRPDPD